VATDANAIAAMIGGLGKGQFPGGPFWSGRSISPILPGACVEARYSIT
jgi:hypothetical protein